MLFRGKADDGIAHSIETPRALGHGAIDLPNTLHFSDLRGDVAIDILEVLSQRMEERGTIGNYRVAISGKEVRDEGVLPSSRVIQDVAPMQAVAVARHDGEELRWVRNPTPGQESCAGLLSGENIEGTEEDDSEIGLERRTWVLGVECLRERPEGEEIVGKVEAIRSSDRGADHGRIFRSRRVHCNPHRRACASRHGRSIDVERG